MLEPRLYAEGVAWLLVTLVIYALSRRANRRYPNWWTSPLLVTWGSLLVLVPLFRSSYSTYLIGTSWLGALVGPATVTFALPIYDQRHLIRRHWPILLAGACTGSLLSVGMSWVLATALHFPDELRLSLLPRSVTTPFAMAISGTIGGSPGLTASFVAITGIFGSTVGPALTQLLRLRSAFASGAALGMAAHGTGVARAYQMGPAEGSIASATMVLAGLLNVLAATIISAVFL